MDALKEAYMEMFGDSAPPHLTNEDLAELAIEGLTPSLHGRVLIQRCKEEIASDPLISITIKDWAKHEFSQILNK